MALDDSQSIEQQFLEELQAAESHARSAFDAVLGLVERAGWRESAALRMVDETDKHLFVKRLHAAEVHAADAYDDLTELATVARGEASPT